MAEEPLAPAPEPASEKPADPAPPVEAAGEPAGSARSAADESPSSERGVADKADEAASPAPGAPAEVARPAAPRPPQSFLWVVSFLSLAADLGTKWWAKSRLDEPLGIRRIEVIKGHFGFVFAKNKGGAWGLLQDEHDAIRRPFFLLISAVAIIFILSLYRRLTTEQKALKWGLPLVLGGALGNLVDRVRYGYVVDFIDVKITKGFTWPTFNVADIAICVGVGLMAVDMFTSRRRPAKVVPVVEAPAKPAAASASGSAPSALVSGGPPAAGPPADGE